MGEIHCNVARDLLPLYVDGVLSEESRQLLEEHLSACPECKNYSEKLTSSDAFAASEQRAKETAALKGIRRKLQTRKLMTICMTAVIVLGIAAAAFYGFVVRQNYVPYEKSGIYIENGILCNDRANYTFCAFEAPDETSLFIYFRASVFENLRAKKSDSPYKEDYMLLHDPQLQDVTQVYYLSRETYVALFRGNQPIDWEEIRANSVLIWEKP